MNFLRRRKLCPALPTKFQGLGILRMTFRALDGHLWSLFFRCGKDYQGWEGQVNGKRTSATRVPDSACRRAKAICSSVDFDFFIDKTSSKRFCEKTHIMFGPLFRDDVLS
jgi:hypothetical protein